jgi:anti-sigma-K factor RskA
LFSKKIQLKGVEKHPDMLAEVYWDSSKKVYLDIKNLPAAPTGKQYQLWAIVEGKPVDMGMYSKNTDSKIQAMKSVEKPQAFAITLEKEGGNATPTMEEMYVMGTI